MLEEKVHVDISGDRIEVLFSRDPATLPDPATAKGKATQSKAKVLKNTYKINSLKFFKTI